MIAADQPRKVEGFAWSIDGDRSFFGVFGDILRGNMLMLVQENIRPDLIGYDNALMVEECRFAQE